MWMHRQRGSSVLSGFVVPLAGINMFKTKRTVSAALGADPLLGSVRPVRACRRRCVAPAVEHSDESNPEDDDDNGGDDAKSHNSQASSLSSASSTVSQTADSEQRLHELLLRWYVNQHRQLPWRADPYSHPRDRKPGGAGTPYAVWVSEIMLQQTRVATVIDYYQRWMQEFPTIDALASATLERVNELWAGLGYYRRAKLLHEGAKVVMERFAGELPSSVKELLDIPGIGPYTAGAIASIAFNRQEALVDGNVARVLSRLHGVEEEPLNRVYWSLARKLLDKGRSSVDAAGKGGHPGDFNQALMELGATICNPKSPECGRCPWAAVCVAQREAKAARGRGGEEAKAAVFLKYPKKAKKTKVREETVATCVVKQGDKFLLLKRPASGLLPGLWEFPTVVLTTNEDRNADVNEDGGPRSGIDGESALLKKIEMLGVEVSDGGSGPRRRTKTSLKSVGQIVHLFSHIRQTLHIYELSLPSPSPSPACAPPTRARERVKTDDGEDDDIPVDESDSGERQWLDSAEIANCAISTQMRKVLKKYLTSSAKKKPRKQHGIESFLQKW